VLENAVLHGISRLPEGGTIEVRLACGGGLLEIDVANPSLPPDDAPAQGAGHAQRSIAHRLAFAFGSRARMHYGWNDGRYACTIQLPVPTGGAMPVPGERTP